MSKILEEESPEVVLVTVVPIIEVYLSFCAGVFSDSPQIFPGLPHRACREKEGDLERETFRNSSFYFLCPLVTY